MDLFRQMREEDARQLVNEYSANEPGILRRDFYNSLLAAFEPQEIRRQLTEAGLTELEVKKISDRQVLILEKKANQSGGSPITHNREASLPWANGT